MSDPVGVDPNYRTSRWRNLRSLWGWRVRCFSYWMKERGIPGDKVVFHIGLRL
jgi:hypothetical protein